VNGWYDFGVAETLYEFNLLRENAESAKGRDHQFVVIGPTTHCSFERVSERTIVGTRDVGDARFDYQQLYRRWFDRWLKGIDTGVERDPKVRLYVMGKNEWRNENEWPLARTRFTPFYLHSAGRANSLWGDGTLGTTRPGDETPDRYTYDPRTPVPSRGGPVCCTGTPDAPEGAFDQSEVEARHDVLVYSTPPLTQGVEVTGPLKVVLYVSSDARDTDFTAKVVDVHPDGTAYNVQEGILRARYRDGFDRTVFMQPGQVYKVEIDLQATSNWFAPGHRLRVEVASSNFPRFDRNLNTGGNNHDERSWKVARNVIHHSARYPSHIVLPVIP
jgi:putative CocE/NonD family hydrolase